MNDSKKQSPTVKEVEARYYTEKDGKRIYNCLTNFGFAQIPEDQILKQNLVEHKKVVKLLALHERLAALEAEYIAVRDELFSEPGTYTTLARDRTVVVKSQTAVEIKGKDKIVEHLNRYLERKQEADVTPEEQFAFKSVKSMLSASLRPGKALDNFLSVKFTPGNSDEDLAAAQKLLREGQVAKPAKIYVNIYEKGADGKTDVCIRKHV